MARASVHSVTLPSGVTVRYVEQGAGRPVVLVHGVMVDASVWRKVLPRLGDALHAIAPTLPLGSHRDPAPPGTDLSLPGQARIVADFLAALDLRDVALVGNDTGGAICQLVAARHPERLGALVLISCDAYENVPPLVVRPMAYAPSLVRPLVEALRLRPARWAFAALVAKHPVPDAVRRAWVVPSLRDPAVRRDLREVLRGLRPRHLRNALTALRRFDRPVTVVWAREDLLFPQAHAQRLAGEFPRARVEWVDDSRTFVPEDQPERLAAILAEVAAP